MRKQARVAALMIAMSAAVPLAATAGDWASTVEAAKAEGRVVLYIGKADAVAEGVLKAFKEKYGIQGEWLRAPARTHLSKLRGEIAAGALQADVVFFPGPESLARLAKTTPAWLPDGPSMAEWPAEYMTSEGIAQLSADPIVIIYNTNAVKPAPSSYWDVTGKGYRQAVSTPASTFRAKFYQLTNDLLGPEYWKAVAADGVITGNSSNALVQGVAAGESDVTVGLTWMAEGLMRKGAPLDWVAPEEGKWALTHWGMALENGPNPNAGKLLFDFMMSPEGQDLLNTDGSVSVYNADGIPMNVDEESLTAEDLLEVADWFEKTFNLKVAK
jgi:iron(III) transport system substrate-binding protein